ncbi:hypothetical protein WS62_17105 [Burkholderia sp. ABCPW 14]|nr:hypothetical protein WS62_17105 [Burkholderia sp. ABCPW 14]
MSLTLSRTALIRTGKRIDGEWRPAASSSRYAVSDPAALDVIADAAPGMQFCGEEAFGPVVALFRFSTESEALAAANDTPYGLAAYFYTQNVRRIARVSSRLEAGVVGINEGPLASEAAPVRRR